MNFCFIATVRIFMENFICNDFCGGICREVKIIKRVSDSDMSNLNAFSSRDRITFTLVAPRRAGITSVSMLIARDGENQNEYKMPLISDYATDDMYSITHDIGELCASQDSGLLYYKFRICVGNAVYYTNSINNIDFSLTRNEQASFRMLVYSPDFTTPRWAYGSTMYHIFVDRFYKGEKDIPCREDAEKNDNWESGIPQYAPYPGAHLENNEFFGGTLWGIAQKLDYLAELGVTTIYLSPIFKAYSNHKYDTGDYLEVDEMFGGNEAFANLIKQAKTRSMKIVLDGVFNHTGDNSRYFDKYRKYGKTGAYSNRDSEYRNWYHFHPDNTYESWWGITILPKLNHANENCRRFFTGKGGVIEKYINEGIGGWRLDVADELSDDFLDELRETAKSADHDAIIIGEVWENAADKVAYSKRRRYFRGRQLDSVMNYPFKNALIEYINSGDCEILYNELVDIYSSYPTAVSNVLMNLLGTHDTERILTVLSDDDPMGKNIDEIAHSRLTPEQKKIAIQRLKVASTIQYTVYGFPSVFYGDEVGIEGYGDPFCRKPFPWHNINRELHEHYKKLGRIRNENPVFAGGAFEITEHNGGLLSYKRYNTDNEILVYTNAGDTAEIIHLNGTYTDLLTGKIHSKETALQQMSALILKKI